MIEVVNYAGFEIVFKSYSMLIFGHTHSFYHVINAG